jgi:hypothetical protein
MTEATEFTCDWGHCDNESIAERLSPQSGEWLAVCARHVGSERRPSPGKASCHHCGTEYVLKVSGTFRLHNRGFAGRCPGSGQQPERTT